jgi:hypothetical protein
MLMIREGLHSKRNKTTRKGKLKPNEWYINDLMQETGVGYGKVHRWIMSRRLEARKDDTGQWVVTADKQQRDELKSVRLAR